MRTIHTHSTQRMHESLFGIIQNNERNSKEHGLLDQEAHFAKAGICSSFPLPLPLFLSHLRFGAVEFGSEGDVEDADSTSRGLDFSSFSGFPGFVLLPRIRVEDALQRLWVVVAVCYVRQIQTQFLRRDALHIVEEIRTWIGKKLQIPLICILKYKG